jgi:hypothetical protein
LLATGGRRFLQERGALGGVRLPATPAVPLDRDRQPYARAAVHVSTERNRGFAPRYYSATHIWASTTNAGTLLPNRVVGLNVDTRWDTPAPRRATRSPGGGPGTADRN